MCHLQKPTQYGSTTLTKRSIVITFVMRIDLCILNEKNMESIKMENPLLASCWHRLLVVMLPLVFLWIGVFLTI